MVLISCLFGGMDIENRASGDANRFESERKLIRSRLCGDPQSVTIKNIDERRFWNIDDFSRSPIRNLHHHSISIDPNVLTDELESDWCSVCDPIFRRDILAQVR